MRRRWRDELLDDFDPYRLHVFVPAIMSVGLLFSVVSLVQDVARWGSERALHRHSRAAGAEAAALVTGHPIPAAHPIPEVRRWLLAGATMGFGVAAYISIGSIANYRRTDGYVELVGWLLALALAGSAFLAVVGGAFAL